MTAFDGNAYRKSVLKPLLDAGATDFADKFALVDLDPATDDADLIRARITEVIAFWRREQSQPRYKGLAAALLAQRDEMSEVLLDPGRRASLRATLSGARQQADAARFERLDEMLEKLAARHRGTVPADRVDRLRAAAARDGVTDAEFDERLARYRVGDVASSGGGAEPLPDLVRTQVRQRLDELNRLAAAEPGSRGSPPVRSLFGFLGVAATATPDDLRDRHQILAARNRQRRHDRLKTVTDELLALALTHVIEGEPGRYQATLALDVADALAPEVEAAVLLDDTVNAALSERLVREAVGWGLEVAVARDVVRGLAARFGGSVEMGVSGNYVLCATCGSAEDGDPKTHRTCRRCGAALYRPCPRCATEVEVSADRCGSCDLDLAATRHAHRLARQAADALAEGRPQAAFDLAEQSAALMGSPEATAVRSQAEDALRAAAATWEALVRAVDGRRFGDAADLVEQLARSATDTTAADGRTLESVRAVVDAELAEVRAAVRQAMAHTGAEREEALVAVVARHPDARDAVAELRAIGVAAPSHVEAGLHGDAVVVSWQPSPSPGSITYRVTRLASVGGAEPTEQPVGSTAATRLEDAGAPAGAFVTYSVTAMRFGQASGGVRSREVLVAREIEGFTVLDGDGRVELSWRQPPGGEVWIARSREDAPEPARQFQGSGGSMLDTAVTNGATYTYRAHVEYRDRAGVVHRTVGVERTASPQAPPAPLRGMLAGCSGGRVTVTWPASATSGRPVRVVRVADLAGLVVGASMPAAQLPHLGRELAVTNTSALDPDAATGARWYVPFTMGGSVAVVGSPIRHHGIDDVTGVTAADEGRDLVVRWQWPDGCTEAQVVYERAGEYAEFEAKVTNSKYQVDGGWRLRDAPPGEYTISVVPGLRDGNELVWAANPGPNARTFHRRG